MHSCLFDWFPVVEFKQASKGRILWLTVACVQYFEIDDRAILPRRVHFFLLSFFSSLSHSSSLSLSPSSPFPHPQYTSGEM